MEILTQEQLEKYVKLLPDEALRNLIGTALLEQKRRLKLTVIKCRERPSLIWSDKK